MKKLLLMITFAALLTGCAAGTPFTYDSARQVKIGMTEAEVVSLMGNPYSVTSRNDEQMWVWSHANAMTGASRVVSFKMKDGKVVEVPTIPASFQ